MRAPLTFEALSIAFFAALAMATPWTRASRGSRHRAALLSAALAALVTIASFVLPTDLRLWLGHAYLVAGYRLPGLLVPRTPDPGSLIPDPGRFEAWLVRADARWFPHRPSLPVWMASILELAYLLCYVLAPAAFAFIWLTASVAVVDRFWTSVLLAGFACYGLLPWLTSRPPRLVDASALAGREGPPYVRRVNEFVLARASHGFNTFPSGHVAVSVAAALSLLSLSTGAGLTALAISAGVAAGAVAGRYHYVIDVVVGAAAGAMAWLLT